MVHGRQFIIFPFDDLILDLTAQTLIDHAEDKTRQRESRILFTYFQSLAVMRKAKDLAASGNVRELEVFASSEVKRTSQSLQERQLSQDGRVKDGEKQAHVKTRKEDLVYENPKKEEQEEEEVDEETFKERKREEQAEKARLPMERKRKLQKKAAAKAAIRAQKEAEKKLKECEKKAKKKAAAANSPLLQNQTNHEKQSVKRLRLWQSQGTRDTRRRRNYCFQRRDLSGLKENDFQPFFVMPNNAKARRSTTTNKTQIRVLVNGYVSHAVRIRGDQKDCNGTSHGMV
ncbi:unnamed protein product [Microthlaspi erraticum]|uniref:Uncharacterized protein n=1 Tax=Microthlaspi erraticum TaxID=1685480 RepID=A0A6D2KQV1_9BRAS|nr:unnamed protein product [Microthlaspi erraticum]